PAPNQLYGHISSNRTLTHSSPGPNYQIIGDLTIDPGVQLTIENDVSVVAVAHSDFLATGSDPTRVELVVKGTLLTLGAGGPAQLSSNSGPGAWVGIDVASGGHAVLNHALIAQSDYGVHVEAGGTASLTECTLVHGSFGLAIETGGSATVSG